VAYTSAYRRILTRMGYYEYQSGLIFRHLNQEGGWDSHLEHCRNFIIRALDIFNPSHITVIGSGWLLDLPLAEMLERSLRVTLVDIVHPPDIYKQTAGIPNVELVELDATGGLIMEVWNKTGSHSVFKKKHSLSDIMIPEFKPDTDPGLVISLNILTQLESRITDFLRKHIKVSDEEFNNFRSEIQKKHITFLKKHKSVIITDYAEVVTNKSGERETNTTLLTEMPESSLKDEWIWDFDMKGSDFYNKRSIIKVRALAI
jgi:hypothetical protein